uniref:Uncharacterized protein n=1 Tax=Rhizophora mucronata TaxID=61149 RepID=A0A2P2N410_RHIMU
MVFFLCHWFCHTGTCIYHFILIDSITTVGDKCTILCMLG